MTTYTKVQSASTQPVPLPPAYGSVVINPGDDPFYIQDSKVNVQTVLAAANVLARSLTLTQTTSLPVGVSPIQPATDGEVGSFSGVPAVGAPGLRFKVGTSSVAAGQGSKQVTDADCTAFSVVIAQVMQAAADGTLLYLGRAVCADGHFTVYGNANATAETFFQYVLFPVADS